MPDHRSSEGYETHFAQRRQIEVEAAHAREYACWLCKRDVSHFPFQRLDFGRRIGVVSVCDICIEKAGEE